MVTGKLPTLSKAKGKTKNEIVTMGVTTVDPNREVGDYVEPAEWNSMISDPNVLVVDVRNSYEVEIGVFQLLLIQAYGNSASSLNGWRKTRKN